MSFTPIKIKLRKPLQHGGEEITELLFGREMVSGDLRGGIEVQRLTHDDIHEVASRLLGLPTPLLKTLSVPDYLDMSAVVTGFFVDSPPTGATP